MKNIFNTEKKFTQSDIAALLNISDRQVRNLMSQGLIPAAKGRNGMDPLACIHAYISYKSQTKISNPNAEMDGEDDDESYEKEKRNLALEDKKESVAMKRAKRLLFEKSYAPIQLIVDVLQQTGSRMNSRLDGLLPKMKSAWPDMPPEAIVVLEAEIVAAANECSDVKPDLTDYIDGDPESGPSWIVGTEENHTS